MKDKYYTPTKEEFHIGFEYEFSYGNDFKKQIYDGRQVLISKSYYDDHGCEYDAVEDDLKYIRVKYLDKDDIEDLGFIPSTNEKHLYYLGDVSLQLHNNNCLTIRYNNKFNNEWRTAVEFIIIKNKSELKRLLKQLNIL